MKLPLKLLTPEQQKNGNREASNTCFFQQA